MKFRALFCFELGYQARRASTWLFLVALAGLTFMIAAQVYVENARTDGYLFNGPFVIAAMTVLAGLMNLPVAAALAGDAATRDVRTMMHPLLYTAPIGRATYLTASWLAAFALNAILLTVVPIVLVLTRFVVGLDAQLLGPFSLGGHAAAYFFIALPNAAVVTALLFAVATLTRRTIASYLGAAAIFILVVFCWQFVAKHLGLWRLGQLLDPLGIAVLSELTQTWTPSEKSTRLIGLNGPLLLNRLVWLGAASGVFALTVLRFQFQHHAERPRARRVVRSRLRGRTDKRLRGASQSLARPQPAAHPVTPPRIDRRFGFSTYARQTIAVARESVREILRSWGGVAIAGLALLTVLTGPELMEYMGVPLVPTTDQITSWLGGSSDLIWMIIPLLIVFYAGELVWRERDAGINAIVDAAPTPGWVAFAGKLLGLGLVLVAVQAALMAAGMVVQMLLGFYEFEIGLYLAVLFGVQLSDYVLTAVLALAIHGIVDQKYVGHLVVLIAYAVTEYHAAFGIEHHLLVYGAGPDWWYSDMRGFAPSLIALVAFKMYWAGWSALLAMAATLLWPRGEQPDFTARLRRAGDRFSPRSAAVLGTCAACIALAGGFIFYNTNVLNDFRARSDWKKWRAEYELKYGIYENTPQPHLAATRLTVEIFPERRAAEIAGSYLLVNGTPRTVDSVHVAAVSDANLTIAFDREAEPVLVDERLGHRIYALRTPLNPGDSVRLDFDLRLRPAGFDNDGDYAAVASNGTHIRAQEWLPAIGYQPYRELSNAGDRRVFGLDPQPPIPALSDAAAPHHVRAVKPTMVEVVVGTSRDQLAVAPGALLRTWVADGRRYFRYATDVPIRNDFSIYSAAYDVLAGNWNGVDIEVIHHPRHDWLVDDMLRSVRASLAYYTEQFGPYPHRQLRLVEHPGDGHTLHAGPVNVSIEEGFALFNPDADRRDLNLPFAVIAHEVAHQWWGNQLIPAPVEGAALLSESLAWYSALMVVEKTQSRRRLALLLELLREAYLVPHSRAAPPLLRADDWLLGYRKGPFVMYLLREYVGEAEINTALRRLLESHKPGTTPPPTSLDLYRELKAATPDSLDTLLADLFESNTYWTLTTTKATAVQSDSRTWRVALDVHARKVTVDSTGAETPVPMNDVVEIGVFGANDAALYLQKHRIRSGRQTITVQVAGEPARAGIDPRSLFIQTDPGANVVDVARPAR